MLVPVDKAYTLLVGSRDDLTLFPYRISRAGLFTKSLGRRQEAIDGFLVFEHSLTAAWRPFWLSCRVGDGRSWIDEDARVEDAVWIESLLYGSDRFGKQFRSLNVVGARAVHSSNSVMVGRRASA